MLFKILRGDSSRISMDITPFHEGWAYFVPDKGAFYIDAIVDGEERRVRIKGDASESFTGGEQVPAILYANGWVDGKQSIAIEGLTARQNGIIAVSPSATVDEEDAAAGARLKIFSQEDGVLTISAVNGAPACNIPVTIILFSESLITPPPLPSPESVVVLSRYTHSAKEYRLLNADGEAESVYRTADDIRAFQSAYGPNATRQYGAIEPELLRYYYVYKSNDGMIVDSSGRLIDENGDLLTSGGSSQIYATAVSLVDGAVVKNADNTVLIPADKITEVSRRVYSAALSNDGTTNAEYRQSFEVKVTATSATSTVVIYGNVPQAFNPSIGLDTTYRETFTGTGRAISQLNYGYTLQQEMTSRNSKIVAYNSTGDDTNRKYPSFEAVATEYVYFDIVSVDGIRGRYVLEVHNADSENRNLIQIPRADGGYDFGIWAYEPNTHSNVRNLTPNVYPLYRTTDDQAEHPNHGGEDCEYLRLEYLISKDPTSLGGWKYVKDFSSLESADIESIISRDYVPMGVSEDRFWEILSDMGVSEEWFWELLSMFTDEDTDSATNDIMESLSRATNLYKPFRYISDSDGVPVLDFKGEYIPTLFGVDISSEATEADLWVQSEYYEAAIRVEYSIDGQNYNKNYDRASDANGANDPCFAHLSTIPSGVTEYGTIHSLAIYIRSENQQWIGTNSIQGQLYELRFNRV